MREKNGTLEGQRLGEEVSVKMRVEDNMRHVNSRFGIRGAWQCSA